MCSLQPIVLSRSLAVSLPLSVLLPLITSFLFLLSLLSCHNSLHLPPPPCSHYFLSFFVFLIFSPICPSSLSFCLISSISNVSHPPPSLLSLSLPLQPNCTGVIHLSHVVTVPSVRPVSHAEPRPLDSKAIMGHVSVLSSAYVSLLELPNYRNAKLNLVPALWLLLTLIIHFYENGFAPITVKIIQIQSHWLGSNYSCRAVSCIDILLTRTLG